jgi:transcriptional regulator with XRE-family HTH domain
MPDDQIPITTGSDLGYVIRRARERRGLTQAEVAELAGFNDRSALSRIEGGKSVAHLDNVLRTLRRLGVTLDATLPAACDDRG